MSSFSVQGFEIPTKTRVIINAWAIAMDPEAWDDPEEFRPERFIGSPVNFRGNDFQFIPFGPGRKMCPGIKGGTPSAEAGRREAEEGSGRGGHGDFAASSRTSTKKKSWMTHNRRRRRVAMPWKVVYWHRQGQKFAPSSASFLSNIGPGERRREGECVCQELEKGFLLAQDRTAL